MNRTVHILKPAGAGTDDLCDAFRGVAGDRCEIRQAVTWDELNSRLSDPGRLHAVVLHGDRGDGRRSGLELVRLLREKRHNGSEAPPVVVVAETGDVASAARAIEAGATDFLVRGRQLPERIATLMGKLTGLFDVLERTAALDRQNASLRQAMGADPQIVGRSPAMRRGSWRRSGVSPACRDRC